MVSPAHLTRPAMLFEVLTKRVGRAASALRYDLSWRLTRPGRLLRRFEQAVTNMTQGICLYDAQDRLQLVNERFCQIYRQPMESLPIGMRFRDILAASIAIGNYPGRTVDDVWSERKAFINRREPGTFLQELGDGRLIAISHQPLPDGGWVATYEDITERRRAELQIKHMAQHDPLTKLPNRLLFGERLEQALAAARIGTSCALICLDLDGFKQVNDVFGHGTGDALLCQVAERLQAGLRGSDIAARLGGDEFAVLLPETGAAEALVIARRLSATLRHEYHLDAARVAQIGASIGIACAPDHTDQPDTLLSYADKALYSAKYAGLTIPRLYEPRLLHRTAALEPDRAPASLRQGISTLRAAASMAEDLRTAVLSGQVHLEYQPVCDCSTMEPVAYEALLRWVHPVRGRVPPNEFIPAAEESGFIVPLGEWVLREACREAARWNGRLSVGVNLSPLNFSQPDLVQTVAAILAETGLPPQRLTIEVTEGLLIAANSTAVQDVIQGLRALGIALWLDDFGIGYANFAALHSMPFTSIKVDRSFLAEGLQGATILGAIIGLGQSCGLTVVAEGVETAEQHALLCRLGCDYVQGYLLGSPAKPDYLPRAASTGFGGSSNAPGV